MGASTISCNHSCVYVCWLAWVLSQVPRARRCWDLPTRGSPNARPAARWQLICAGASPALISEQASQFPGGVPFCTRKAVSSEVACEVLFI